MDKMWKSVKEKRDLAWKFRWEMKGLSNTKKKTNLLVVWLEWYV